MSLAKLGSKTGQGEKTHSSPGLGVWTWPWRCNRVVEKARTAVVVVVVVVNPVVQPDIAAARRLGMYNEDEDWGMALTTRGAAQVGNRRVVVADSLARPVAIVRVVDILRGE